jgi:hypothetical protein
MKERQMISNKCAISSNTFRSIYLIVVIGGFKNGVFGLKRLQKITYLSEVDSPIKPYTFKRHFYGQYSEELANTNNQLIQLNYVSHNLLLGSQCSVYSISKTIDISYYRDILKKIDPELVERISETIDEFGYLSEEKLIELCYSLPSFKGKNSGDVVLESVIPDKVEITGLNLQQCEELELAFSAPFINSMLQIVEGMENTTIDFNKVNKVAIRI